MTGVRSSQNNWSVVTHDGSWVANYSAGGCRNYISELTFLYDDFLYAYSL